MEITPEAVIAQRAWILNRSPTVTELINDTRTALGTAFRTDVGAVGEKRLREEVRTVFADGEVAVNVAGYVVLLRDLDVSGDYPGFVVDEVLGRELAATIAGGDPLGLLAQATFHYADVHTHGDAGSDGGDGRDDERSLAGADDLDAALAAGFQTRLPGWSWREDESPFAVDPDG